MQDGSEIEQRVRQFITDNFVIDGGPDRLEGTVSLTQSGVFDSMGVLEMVMFIEERFGVPVPDGDTVPENLDSVDRIVRYVGNRLTHFSS